MKGTSRAIENNMKVSWEYDETAFGVTQNVNEEGFEVKWSDGVVDYSLDQSKYIVIL